MIGAAHYSKLQPVSLAALEDVWSSELPANQLLHSLQPLLARIIVKPDQTLFLDMMKFTAMLVAELYEDVDSGVLCSFTERFLTAAHRAAAKYFDNPHFDQNRFLDCIAAILSVWTDCTGQTELIIPKFIAYTRASNLHILDTILQSVKISDETKARLLDQIATLPNIEIFVKYVIVGRKLGKCKLLALSQQPARDELRCWLVKHNITTITSVTEFLNNDNEDQDILSAMCRPFYNLPPRPGLSPIQEEKNPESEPVSNPDTLFFFDRGSKVEPAGVEDMKVDSSPVNVHSSPVKVDNIQIASVKVDNSPLLPLASAVLRESAAHIIDATQVAQPASDVAEQRTNSEPEPCIKIKNQRKRSKTTPTSRDVIVLKARRSETKENDGANAVTTTNSTLLTKEKLSALHEKRPLVRQSARVRRISGQSDTSILSITSVDSVASRTRNRRAAEPGPAPLQAISEEGKSKGTLSTVKRLKTPAARSTPKVGTTTEKGTKSRKISETIDETPQIPVRKTRSRKIKV